MEGFAFVFVFLVANSRKRLWLAERENDPKKYETWRKYDLGNMAAAEHVSSLVTLCPPLRLLYELLTFYS